MDIIILEDPAIPLLGIYPEDVPTCNKDTLHYVHSSLIYNSQKLERTQMPLNRNGYRKCGRYIYTMEYYSAIKNFMTS